MHDIFQGWYYYFKFVLGFEDSGLYKMAKERRKICNVCEYKKNTLIGAKCNICGCFIGAKIRCHDCVCPDVRW